MRILALLLALFATPAVAQECAPHGDVVAALSERFSEQQRLIALTENGTVLEFYGAESGTWTILITSPNGMACLVAAGSDFEIVAPVIGDPA